jgi:hypothetical protein
MTPSSNTAPAAPAAPSTLTAFCAANGITATSKPGAAGDWTGSPGSTHWTVTLRNGRRTLTTPFHMGSAHKGAPEVADVLACLISDESSGAMSFEEFCGEFGYDTDSREAERTWKSCARMSPKVRTFLGDLLEEAQGCEH